MRLLASHGAIAVIALIVGASSAAAQTAPLKWGPFIDFEGKLGSDRDIGEADIFVPLVQSQKSMFFTDVRTRLDNDNSREGNFGLGIRSMMDADWNLGIYGYFDRRRTENHNYFSQMTLGAEILSLNWDVRANYYAPAGRRKYNVDGLSTAEVSGTTVIFRGGEERSLEGFDGEIGWRVPVFAADAGQQLRVFGGGYRFYADAVEPVQGPRARAEFTFDELPFLWEGSRFTLGAEAQHDGPRGDQYFGVARLRVPLQIYGSAPSKLSVMEKRMTAPIVRDVDIVSQAGNNFSSPETVTQIGGSSFSVLNSATTTTGAALITALSNAGNNSTVLLSGSFSLSGAQQISLNNGQKVMSGPMTVQSPSGRSATLNTSATISGTNPTTTNTMIQVNSNGTLSGLTITTAFSGGAGGTAVRIADTAGGSVVTNNTITVTQSGANAGNGLAFGANTGGTIRGNTITVTGSGGATTLNALVINAGGTFTISGNTFSSSGGNTASVIVENGTASPTISAGSTGNIRISGTCSGTSASGSISFTNGTTCP